MNLKPETLSRLLVASYIVICGAVMVFALANYRAAAQDLPENYFYFMQFYAKYADPVLPDEFAPLTGCLHGHNIFFLDGCDGAAGLEKGIHFEPYKYVFSLIYWIFETPLVLFALFILLFYSPLLYGARLIKARPEYAVLLTLALLAYALYPGAAFTAIIALRPMVLFFPFFTLFFLSILFRRNPYEQFLFLNLLLAIREDALVLAGVGIAFLFWREWRERSGHRTSLLMLANWGAWLIANAVYFSWLGDAYRFYVPASGKLKGILENASAHPFLLVLVFVALVAAGVWALVRLYRAKIWNRSWFGTAIVLGVPTAFMVALLTLGWSAFPWTAYFIYNRIGTLVCLFALLTLLACAIEGPRVWKLGWGRYAVAALLPAFVILNVVGPSSALSQFKAYWAQIPDAQLLYETRAALPEDAGVLGDMQTSQVLYDRPKTALYNGYEFFGGLDTESIGLPVFHKIDTEEELASHLGTQYSYVLIEKKLLPELAGAIQLSGHRLVPIRENSRYGFYSVK